MFRSFNLKRFLSYLKDRFSLQYRSPIAIELKIAGQSIPMRPGEHPWHCQDGFGHPLYVPDLKLPFSRN